MFWHAHTVSCGKRTTVVPVSGSATDMVMGVRPIAALLLYTAPANILSVAMGSASVE